MAQHTPAPWTLREDRTIWGPNGRFVADLDGRPTTAVDDANAKLMAASPELAALLNRYMNAYPAFRMKPVGSPGSEKRTEQENLMALEDDARAALARTEG